MRLITKRNNFPRYSERRHLNCGIEFFNERLLFAVPFAVVASISCLTLENLMSFWPTKPTKLLSCQLSFLYSTTANGWFWSVTRSSFKQLYSLRLPNILVTGRHCLSACRPWKYLFICSKINIGCIQRIRVFRIFNFMTGNWKMQKRFNIDGVPASEPFSRSSNFRSLAIFGNMFFAGFFRTEIIGEICEKYHRKISAVRDSDSAPKINPLSKQSGNQ